MRTWNVGLSGWCIWVTLVSTASASPFRLTGYDGYAVGKANAQSAYGGGVGVLYSNPALLMDLDRQVSFGVLLVQPRLRVGLFDRPANSDVPITLYDSDVGIEGDDLDRALPTSELPNIRSGGLRGDLNEYISLGLIHSLGLENFRFGFSILLPASGFLSAVSHYSDEREQYFSNTVHFTRVGEWSRSVTATFGAAYRIASKVSVGLSLETSIKAQAKTGVYIPEATVQDYAQTNITLESGLNTRAILGVSVEPLDLFRVSLVWRDRRYIRIESDAMVSLWNFHESGTSEAIPKRVRQYHLLALDFEPMELNISAGMTLDKWKLEAGVTWNHWADYIDTHHKRAQETAVFEDPNQPGVLIGDGDTFAFEDTFSLSLGCSFEHSLTQSFLAGFSYRPTPVPPQVGRTNYVDNDLLIFAIGYRLNFEIGLTPAHLDVGIQGWYLVPAEVHKDPDLIRDEFADRAKTLVDGKPMPESQGLQTNNPGFPGYEHDGWTLVGSVSLSYLF